MASRKSPSAPAWQAILEKIESQNRLTIEAVQVNRAITDQRIQSLEDRLGGRLGNVEMARQHCRRALELNPRYARASALLRELDAQ